MKLRFNSPELALLLLSFLVIGFTAGYLYANGFSFRHPEQVTEGMILLGTAGILGPLIFGLYLISRGVLGSKYNPGRIIRRKPARKKHLENA
ncbi:MAG: hypothetical protein ACO1OQ_03080 [Rufibacter sp.]